MVVAYYNGEFIDVDEKVIPIEERGHNFGDGIYDVIRVYKGKPFMLEEHIDRIFMNAEAIHLRLERSREELKNELFRCLERSGEENADIYMQVTRGIAARNHLFLDCPVCLSIVVKPTHYSVKEKNSVIFHPDERWSNCYIKSLNLLPNVLAKQDAVSKGSTEAVFVKDGYVTEGTHNSVFIVNNETIIVTPLSKQILSSITRMAVKRIAERLSIAYLERHFTPEEMMLADEVFIAGTTTEVLEITLVEDKVIGSGSVGKVTEQIQREFWNVTGISSIFSVYEEVG